VGSQIGANDLLDKNVPDSHQILDGRDINANEDTIVRDRLRPGILLASMGEKLLILPVFAMRDTG